MLRRQDARPDPYEDIERYVAAKRKTLAVKTIRNHGLRKGWCQMNPVKLADRPTVKRTETRIQFASCSVSRWRDVDLDARKIRVVSPFVRGEFGNPKSAGSGRWVPMAERAAVALSELRERSFYTHDRDLVFCHPATGKPLDRSKLVRRFKQALDRAGVHRITFHELRHTFGTRMAAAGTPMRTLQHRRGHAGVAESFEGLLCL